MSGEENLGAVDRFVEPHVQVVHAVYETGSRLVAGTQIVARTEIGVGAMRSKIGQLVSIPATFFLIGKRQCRLDSCGASSADGHEAANYLMLDEQCTEPHGAGERGGALLPTPSRPCSLDLQSEK